MTPSNPDNNQPLILRIADALGVLHLVAPVNHIHSKSEVSGLENTLSVLSHEINASNNNAYGQVKVEPNETDGKVQVSIAIEDDSEETDFLREAYITWSNIKNFIRALRDPDTTPTASSDNLVTSGGVKTALNGKANSSHNHSYLSSSVGGKLGVYQTDGDEYIYIALFDNGTMYEYGLTHTDLSNAFSPDTTPTLNSNKLVTSGGVATALAGKMDAKTIDSTPANNADNLVSSKGVFDALAGKADDVNVRYNEFARSDDEVIDLDEIFSDNHMVSHFVLQNNTNASCNISDFFASSSSNIHDNGETVPQYAFAIVKVIMYDNGSQKTYLVVVDGIYEI